MPDVEVERLIAAIPLARRALTEITSESSIGESSGYSVESDGVVSLFFDTRLSGYPGWRWCVTVALAAPELEPTVLEAELIPGDGALTATEWVPWSERLAEYEQSIADAAAGASVTDDADAEETDDDFDDTDFDTDDSDGDIDGIDIDSAFDDVADLAFDQESLPPTG